MVTHGWKHDHGSYVYDDSDVDDNDDDDDDNEDVDDNDHDDHDDQATPQTTTSTLTSLTTVTTTMTQPTTTTVTSIATVTQCPSGTPDECSNNTCVNLLIDVNHCGTCDHACPITAYCLKGVCICPFGQIVCYGECITENVCVSPGFSARACIADNSIGAGNTPWMMMTIFGDASFTPFQCYSACRKPATTFFTLVVDTNASNDINTICSCFVGPLTDISKSPTPCNQNYGHTYNGTGSWQLYAIA